MKLNASSNPEIWCQFSDSLRSGCSKLRSPRTLVLAAHPDDESIGASVPLSSSNDSWVLFLTDGAPQNSSLRSSYHELSREGYARVRAGESKRALACAGVAPNRIMFFDCIDQEAIYNTAALVKSFVERLKELRPEIVITHPYEGGHPDHDATALIASVAQGVLLDEAGPSHNIPLLVEMSSYHAVNQQLHTGEFLSDSSRVLALELTAEQCERKRCMFSCYPSQATVLQSFNSSREVFRPAPVYDFHAAPHEGKLWYECLGWEMTSKEWCSLAADALAHFDRYACR